MTAAWSKGKRGQYAYYLCRQKGCERSGKGIVREKINLAENIAKCGTVARGYSEVSQTSLDFTGNSWKLWANENFEDCRAMARIVFADHLIYCRENGFQAPEISMPFRV